MKLNKNNVVTVLKYLGVLLVGAGIVGVTWAAFSDKGDVLGSSFSVGNSDIKLLNSLTNGTIEDNLRDTLPGPSFANISPNWTQDYLIKLYNNGTTGLQLSSNSNYATANDPDDLRSYIYVEIIPWNDENNNGIVDTAEEGASFGKKTITKWKTEGIDLGTINVGTTAGYILRFSVGALSDTKQGKSAIFDFEFNAIQQ